MNCEQANQMNLVDYLYTLGYSPKKIIGNNYWYHSPFRQERTPSFKIDRAKNLWYDFGKDKGGKTVDFAKVFFYCDTSIIAGLNEKMDSLIEKLSKPPKEEKAKTRSININTAKEILGISKQTIYGKSKSGIIPSYKHENGKDLYFFEDELQAYLKSNHKRTLKDIDEEVDDFIIRNSRKRNYRV